MIAEREELDSFEQIYQKKLSLVKNSQNEHQHRVKSTQISLFTKFQLKSTDNF